MANYLSISNITLLSLDRSLWKLCLSRPSPSCAYSLLMVWSILLLFFFYVIVLVLNLILFYFILIIHPSTLICLIFWMVWCIFFFLCFFMYLTSFSIVHPFQSDVFNHFWWHEVFFFMFLQCHYLCISLSISFITFF